jgi:hypothetical protein
LIARVACVAATAALLLPTSSGMGAQGHREIPRPVSLIRLIGNGAAYDGVLVSVIGYLRLEYEGDILYVSENDFKNGIVANGVRVEASEQMRRDKAKFSDKYVMLVGTYEFDREKFSETSGTLVNIQRVTLWSDPAAPQRGPRTQ